MHLNGILFIDIETVPLVPDHALLNETLQFEWAKKARSFKDAYADTATAFGERAGIFSEFAKVVCISFGSIVPHDNVLKMRLKSIAHDDEHTLLQEFCVMLGKFIHLYKDIRFCGHNIKEFDIPFLCRRMIINNMNLPECMQVSGKKPWEVSHIDTMELWRFGDYKSFTSLSLLAAVLGLPSPKVDLDGSKVAHVYWHDKDLQRIATYCMQDVLTTARVYLRLKGMTDANIEPEYV